MESFYDPFDVERRARAMFPSLPVHEDAGRPKYYCLSMLPYPSGRLHMGHLRNYTIGDAISRYRQLRGFNVFQPMGWDAFGLPAENAARAFDVSPKDWTYRNIERMRAQLQCLGLAINWDREIATCSPSYYRWEQWLFKRFWEKGLIYTADGTVNWDPVDQTVLANEQVIQGRGWRSGALVERRQMQMYYFRISQYADELLDELDSLLWPESVKLMQKKWIGRSPGVDIDFFVDTPAHRGSITVFTSRVDTLFGVTYLAIAIDHALAVRLSKDSAEILNFIEKESQFSGTAEASLATKEKRGIPTGCLAVHPLTGEKIPIWIANYVVSSYGSAVLMGVPAHDERDFQFASRYQLPIKPVIATHGQPLPYLPRGVLIDSSSFTGLSSDEAALAIARHLEKIGKGRPCTHYRLRDWAISRQRYWGCPIPLVHCDHCGCVPVPDEQLPVVLPEQTVFGAGLQAFSDWLVVPCPVCGGAARRETDTLDTFFESSWYFLRYCCADNDQAVFDQRVDYWLSQGGVDQYVGGIEHAVMHLLYARFFTKALRDLGLLKVSEPFRRLLTQGMVTAEAFYQIDSEGRKVWVNAADCVAEKTAAGVQWFLEKDRSPVFSDGVQKMSKSKNNGIDPKHVVDRYGADTARLFMLFAAPPEQSLVWSDQAVEGSFRYLKRLWSVCSKHIQKGSVPAYCSGTDTLSDDLLVLRRRTHQSLKKVLHEYEERLQLNTVVSELMALTNIVCDFVERVDDQSRSVVQETLQILLLMAYPLIPHMTTVLWPLFVPMTSLHEQVYPVVDESVLLAAVTTLVVQVNGKKRATVDVCASASEEEIRRLVVSLDKLVPYLENKVIERVLVVPGRLVNIVLT